MKGTHIFQLRHLRKFCQKHELDEHFIDSTLTFYENKKYLKSLVPNFDPETHLDEWGSKEEEYMTNHFLWFYISCIRDGTNRSAQDGEPVESTPQFSLRAFVAMHK